MKAFPSYEYAVSVWVAYDRKEDRLGQVFSAWDHVFDDPLRIAYLLASLLDMKAEDKQRLLEETSLSVKLHAVSMALSREIEVLELKGRIESEAEKGMTDAQRQYVLRQQLKAIQTELGEGDTEAQELRKRVAEANLPESVAAIAMREVDRLERMTPASPEYQMIRTYLDWVLDVPWSTTSEDRLDPVAARRRRSYRSRQSRQRRRRRHHQSARRVRVEPNGKSLKRPARQRRM